MLEESVASLKELLDDLAILSRLEAGHEQPKLQQFDASAMLRELCATMRPLAAARNLFLVREGPGTLFVEGDIVKVQRIAQNLILNAIRYTERGGAKITWGETKTSELEQWELCVQDTGPGFQHVSEMPLMKALKDASEEADILDRPSHNELQAAPILPAQSNRRPREQEPGEGIGLSIVKRLAELLDATLELQTASGKGSTFRVVFPRRYDHTNPRP